MDTRIKDLRQDRDLTQKDVANFLNVNQRTYSRYELGQHEMTIETICKLADYYNVSVDYLLKRTNIKTPYKKN